MIGQEVNCSWGQPVLGSNSVSGWESLKESSGISEPQSLLSGDTNPSSQASWVSVPSVCSLHNCLRLLRF